VYLLLVLRESDLGDGFLHAFSGLVLQYQRGWS
jgi:hypothetical protein